MAAPTDDLTLASKYTREEGRIFLNGIQSLVRLPLDHQRADRRRGLRTGTIVSGYPGSPLGGLDLELLRQRRLLEEHDVTFTPGLNEELAATAIFGSQVAPTVAPLRFDGLVGIWYGKGPGLDRAGDALKHANFAGVGPTGGALFLAGDDPSSKSSSIPSRCETAFVDALVPVVYPGNVQEILDLGLHALMLSRSSGLVAGMKLVTNVVDGCGTALVAPGRVQPVVPELEVDGEPYRHRPNAKLSGLYSLEMERTIHEVRLELARRYARENRLNEITVATSDAWLGIVAAGKTYYDLRQALEQLGLDESALRRHGIRLLKVGLLFPLEPEIVRTFADGLEEILVVEEKQSFLEVFVKEILYGRAQRPAVVGKTDEHGDPLVPSTGELDPDLIARVLGSRLGRRIELPSVAAHLRAVEERAAQSRRTPLELARTPYFCSGCPHNRSIALPAGSLAGGGIGCHGMALRMDARYVGLTQMGGEGAQWLGIAPFTDTPHLFQNLGDGTYFHSGSLAVSAAVAAGVNITYKLLYNDAVAMTGGQRVAGSISVPELTHRLAADGVKRIIVTTEDRQRYRRAKLAEIAEVWHRDRIVEAQELLATVPGVTVLIHDQACAAELRRLRKKGKAPDPPQRLFIDERVCEGCGDCGRKSNCLSVQPVDTAFGDKTQIHQASCNKDYSCLLGECPSFVSVVPAAEPRRERVVQHVEVDLPEPEPALAREFALRMTGIGGTGVITINQILGTAALMDGRYVCGLDQTGLAQKGGPVVSDLRIGSEPLLRANKLATAEADLYLGLDMLVAADAKHLQAASPERTLAIVSTSQVPTGEMIGNRNVRFPSVESVQRKIDQVTLPGANVYVDVQELAEGLFGDHMPGNVMLLGLAYQLGALPLSRASIEHAIILNGVAVDANLAAFAWGRLLAVDPERVLVAARQTTAAEPAPDEPNAEARALIDSVGADSELRQLLEIRVPDLIAYQDAKYAERYVAVLRRTLAEERRLAPGDERVTIAVARYLYKLMAYKDEYEVARLLLEGEHRIAARFGSTAKYRWNLHPPLLRALGLKRKIALGRWFRPGFRLLRRLRFLRGTPLDPFGYARLRRLERQLVGEYRELVEAALAGLRPETKTLVEAIASLPDEIRGYEHVKLESVDRYRKRKAELLAELAAPPEVDRSRVATVGG